MVVVLFVLLLSVLFLVFGVLSGGLVVDVVVSDVFVLMGLFGRLFVVFIFDGGSLCSRIFFFCMFIDRCWFVCIVSMLLVSGFEIEIRLCFM